MDYDWLILLNIKYFTVVKYPIYPIIKCSLDQVPKKMKFFFPKLEIFYETHPPTRHIKYKNIDFVPCNKSIMANKLLSTSLERFIRRINSPLTR